MYQLKPLVPILLICIGCRIQALGQQLAPQTISAAGQSYNVNNLLLESSVGGLAVADNSTIEFMYTPGFLQPQAGTTTTIAGISNVVLSSGSGLDNAGASFKAGNAAIDFTVGEWISIAHLNSSHMLTQGILQPYQQELTLPVTGLTFTAKRINESQVQLNWKTIQEMNNTGFYIERKNANENGFRTISFIPTKAPNGNSLFPLEYATRDTNSYHGKSWYRILQKDIQGDQSYSVIRMVEGNAAKETSLKAWPVPAIGHFTVMAQGIEQDLLQVFDLNGKMLQQKVIQNAVGLNIQNLPPGTYILRLASKKELFIKAMVQ